MHVLLSIALAMAGGLVLSRIVKLLKLPNVTGYLIAGLLVGPCCFNLVNETNLAYIKIISTVALGFIAFSIGGEFKIEHIKKLGKSIVTITFCQALFAVAFVMLGLFALKFAFPEQINTPMILLLGAIATATAPAATLMVVKQYRARGIVTDTLLPVVALDDAIGLMVFSICVALAKVFATGEQLTVMSTLVTPLLEIVLSLTIGGVLGLLLALCMKFFKSRANRLCLMIVAVLAGVGLSEMKWPMGLSLSSLLTCMMIGAVFANMRKDSLQILDGTENWTPPLYMLFFVISGAELDLKVIPMIGIAGVAYIIFRSLGKYIGAFSGASLVKADKNVRNFLGLTLLPQAGVAIGMAQVVANTQEFAAYSSQIVTIVLCATLIYELVGPLITKVALEKAGEIEKSPKKIKTQKVEKTCIADASVSSPEANNSSDKNKSSNNDKIE